jgi:HEAT repeat protein
MSQRRREEYSASENEMNRSVPRISESVLNTDLNELSHSLVRELAMACKKVAIYGSHHPLASRALEKPFLMLERIFRFKRFVNINLQRGYLYILNIRLKDSVFNNEIIQFMQLQDVTAILFESGISMGEFTRFVERLVTRIDLSDPKKLLSVFLRDNNILSVQVNSEQAVRMFEQFKQYRGDVDGDFSIKHLIFERLGDNLTSLGEVNLKGEAALAERAVDYSPDIIRYLLPERIASLSWERIRAELTGLVNRMEKATSAADRTRLVDEYMAIFKLVDFHPDRERIVDNLEHLPENEYARRRASSDMPSPVDTIKIESREQTDNCIHEIFRPGNDKYEVNEFRDAYRRLLKTGQRGKAMDVVKRLMDHLESPQVIYRQKALDLLLTCVGQFQVTTDLAVVTDTIDRIIVRITEHRETYEYSEFVWSLLEKLMLFRRYDLMARLTVGIAIRRKLERGITIYDSMAIKKVFSSLNRSEIIRGLIDEMVRGSHQEAGHIRDILVAAGSEEVALELSRIISHPVRHVRQQALKILSELGKASLKVFSQILVDDAMFERESGRHELPDSKWYVIRNSIFLLAQLGDVEGINPLRLRINDLDVRVRREIVSALEKIGGEDACDLLVVMANDPEKEIRESAMIAVGLIGTPDVVPLVIDVIKRNPAVAIRAIASLGKLGGDEARSFLVQLLEEGDEYAKASDGQVSKEDLRLSVVRALGSIGDDKAISKIKDFKDNLSTTQKIFFKNSPLQREISSILTRNK